MRRIATLLPTIVTLGAAGLLLLHGPVRQFPDYNRFADRATLLGIPNARNVLSNLGCAIVAALRLPQDQRRVRHLRWPGETRSAGFWHNSNKPDPITLGDF